MPSGAKSTSELGDRDGNGEVEVAAARSGERSGEEARGSCSEGCECVEQSGGRRRKSLAVDSIVCAASL